MKGLAPLIGIILKQSPFLHIIGNEAEQGETQ